MTHGSAWDNDNWIYPLIHLTLLSLGNRDSLRKLQIWKPCSARKKFWQLELNKELGQHEHVLMQWENWGVLYSSRRFNKVEIEKFGAIELIEMAKDLKVSRLNRNFCCERSRKGSSRNYVMSKLFHFISGATQRTFSPIKTFKGGRFKVRCESPFFSLSDESNQILSLHWFTSF